MSNPKVTSWQYNQICKWQIKSFVFSHRLMGVSWLWIYVIMLPSIASDFQVAQSL